MAPGSKSSTSHDARIARFADPDGDELVLQTPQHGPKWVAAASQSHDGCRPSGGAGHWYGGIFAGAELHGASSTDVKEHVVQVPLRNTWPLTATSMPCPGGDR